MLAIRAPSTKISAGPVSSSETPPNILPHKSTIALTLRLFELFSVRSISVLIRLEYRMCDRKVPAVPHRHKSKSKAEDRACYVRSGGREMQHTPDHNGRRADQCRDRVEFGTQILTRICFKEAVEKTWVMMKEPASASNAIWVAPGPTEILLNVLHGRGQPAVC